MIVTPDVPNLPFLLKSGVKYFELVAEPVTRELIPGLYIKGWDIMEVFLAQQFWSIRTIK